MQTKESMPLFELPFPLPRTHCGVVMGNGNFGAMVWGKDRLHVTVNRADFWDHRGGELIVPGTTYRGLVDVSQQQDAGKSLEKAISREEFPPEVFKPQRLPVGRFEFSFAEGVQPKTSRLDYQSGTVSVVLSNEKIICLDLCLSSAVLLIDDPDKQICAVTIHPSWDFQDARDWLLRCGFQEPERFGNGWVQPCPSDPSLACLCEKTDGGYVVALELGEKNDVAKINAQQAIQKSEPDKIRESNQAWWENYWKDIPAINLADDWFNTFYKYSLYRFAAATHPNGYACSLQGPWHEEYKRAEWSGDYHFNVNVQEIYGLAFSTGKFEHLLPLFNMIESDEFQKALRHNAKVMFDLDDGLWFTHAVDDRGWQCGWLIPGSVLDPVCGAWTAQLYWKYYSYSGDTEFLRTRAYPFIRDIMRCYEEMLEEYQGRLSIPLAISAEYGCSNPMGDQAGRDPSYQLSATHMLADYLLEASTVLGTQPKPIWLEIKKRLPEYTVVQAKEASGKSEERIAIWEGQDLEVCHRHHSHLAGIYPFETLLVPTPVQTEIIDNTVDNWILKGTGQWSEWCIPWAACIYTRLGFTEAPMLLFSLWKEIFVNEGLSTVYLPRSRGLIAHRRHDLQKPKETNEFIQLDGTMGAATALLDMLAYRKGDAVCLFHGIPQRWANVSFENIHLAGGIVISAKRHESVTLTSPIDRTLTLLVDGAEKIVNLISYQPVTVQI